MFDFYTIVTISAILLLIISLTTIGVVIVNSRSGDIFPIYQNTCPDYWVLDGKNCKAVNTHNLGTIPIKTPLPTYDVGDKNLSLCTKYKWAKSNNIQWDGVSNTNKDCKNNT